MSTTALITPPTPAGVDDSPTFGEMLDEVLPLIGVVVVAGPPVLLLAGPLVLGALILAGPFALAATMVLVVIVALVAAAVLLALTGAVLATPYLLVRRLRGHREGHAHIGAPAAQLVAVDARHGVA
jgi:hypothetical protein